MNNTTKLPIANSITFDSVSEELNCALEILADLQEQPQNSNLFIALVDQLKNLGNLSDALTA